MRTYSVCSRTAETQQNFVPVIIASRHCSVLLILTRTFLDATGIRGENRSNLTVRVVWLLVWRTHGVRSTGATAGCVRTALRRCAATIVSVRVHQRTR